MKHQKHSKLNRKKNDIYAPNEVSLVGAKCSVISELVGQIAIKLENKYKIAYIDASHSEETTNPIFDTFTFHHSGSLDVVKTEPINKFNERVRFNMYDVSFINGNHFEGTNQIVFLDKEKENSIKKRIDQINNVLLFVKKDPESIVFDVLKEKFDNINDIPVFDISDVENISRHIDLFLSVKKPDLKGLVLIGGKSSRMGKDKSKLVYFGKEHSIYLADLLKQQHLETFLSVRKEGDFKYPIIKDRFLDLGPFGAICSAFLNNPNNAYFVLATDLPYINSDLIELLIKNRDYRKIATTIKGISKEFPEPLITIWEPKAYPVLLSYLAQGISCPRKVLINSDVKIIEVADHLITNINTLEDYSELIKKIK